MGVGSVLMIEFAARRVQIISTSVIQLTFFHRSKNGGISALSLNICYSHAGVQPTHGAEGWQLLRFR